MSRREIIQKIKAAGRVSIPQLQQTYGIGYKEAKSIVDELVENGELVYTRGVVYCTKIMLESDDGRLTVHSRVHQKVEAEVVDKAKPEPKPMSLSEYFKAKAKQYDLKVENPYYTEQDDDDDDDDLESLLDNEVDVSDENALRRKALKLCMQSNNASVSFLQRTLPIGYIKACKLIDWMEEQGYISKADGPHPRKILITEAEYTKKFSFANLLDDDDDDEENPFDVFERRRNDSSIEEFRKRERQKMEESRKELLKKFDETANKVKETLIPSHNSWTLEMEFYRAMRQRRDDIVKSNGSMGIKGALKMAENFVNEFKKVGDQKTAEVYERIAYDFRHMSPYEYTKLKKKFFP